MNKNDIDKLLDDLHKSPTPKPNPEARNKPLAKPLKFFAKD